MTEPTPKRKMTMGTKILIGVVAGIAVGVFLGDRVGVFDVVGNIYVGLLQMTVLPYVVVSLIGKIGGLTAQQAKQLGGRAGLITLALWALSLVVVVLMPLSLPAWDAGTFFSASLVEQPRDFDFLGLYVPTNPFRSLAENVVPASVLFSILVGVALISVRTKDKLLDVLDITSQTLGNLSNFVVQLSPWGTFALAAAAAGTLSPPELTRLAGYVVTYTVAVVLVTFVIFPGLTAALTPFRFRKVLSGYREAGLTAFATGKLFAVLPMVITSVRDLLVDEGVDPEEAQKTADVYVPLAYPFPNAGKILSLLFLPFAAWFIGRPLGFADYPLLLSVGLLSFFGSPVAAIPFLLDLLKLPLDLFPLFLVAGIWCARVGDVLGAMHLYVFTSLASAWNQGWLKLHPVRLARWAILSIVATIVSLFVNGWLVAAAVADQEPSSALIQRLDFFSELGTVRPTVAGAPNPEKRREGESWLKRIQRTKVLRYGFERDHPPFAYHGGSGRLVGMEVELMRRLAEELGVELQPVEYRGDVLVKGFREDWFDIAGGPIPSSIDTIEEYRESPPYLELNLAFLCLDGDVKLFQNRELVLAKQDLSVAFLANGSYFVRTHAYKVPNAKLVPLETIDDFVNAEVPPADALIISAETGSVLTMLHPRFSIVIPAHNKVRVPVVFALPPAGTELRPMIDRWINIKEGDGTIAHLYGHWILGEQTKVKPPRWSIIHDVLGWVD